MIKLLIGGSPCTKWSIAQNIARETEPSGAGWELFKNYIIAKEKFKPDFFLYENNKSASQAIKDQIKQELKVHDGTFLMKDTGARYIEINSALVSAQNRQRFYVHNCGEVEQPEDREILFNDILESGTGQRQQKKARTLTAGYMYASQRDIRMDIETDGFMGKQGVIERIDIKNLSSKPLFAVPICDPESYLSEKMVGYAYKEGTKNFKQRVKILENKACPLTTEQNKRAGTTNYIPQNIETIECGITTDGTIKNAKPIYEVKDGFITIKGKQYPTKLADGYYILRKLTVNECCRLQTMPDDYCRAVSNAQAYRGLGNGWTAEVIIHILWNALKNIPKDEEIIVLSMYDGIGTGRYCLDKMGFTNVKYYAYEIDKYAMQIAMSNYPDIIQMGDAFQVREEKWNI